MNSYILFDDNDYNFYFLDDEDDDEEEEDWGVFYILCADYYLFKWMLERCKFDKYIRKKLLKTSDIIPTVFIACLVLSKSPCSPIHIL